MKLRYIFAVGVFVTLFTLSACGEKTKVLTLTEFQSEVTVVNSESEIIGSFEFKGPEDITFTVNSPEELKGMTVLYANDKLVLTCGGISLPLESVSMGEDVFFPLFDAVTFLSSSQTQIREEGISTFNLTSEKGEYKTEFSSDEMKILSFENKGITYSFRY